MQPSSLVFLVIIAVWAAYFVQYWVRRREHLATARSVDQFSESMRVLERRSPLPVANLSAPSPRSYAVSPARPARPQILVKRAETAESPVPSGDPRGEAPVPHVAPRVAARQTRALVMLGALSTVLVAAPLVALSLLPLLTLLVPVVCVGAAMAWVRATAMAERRMRHGRAPARADVRADARRPSQEPARRVVPEVATPAAPAIDDLVSEAAAGTASAELYDVQAVEAAERPVAAPVPAAPTRHLVDDDDIPLTWDPVPVPRPTYTMKSRATRPAPTAADLVGDADTEYAAYEQRSVRRAAGA